MAEPGHVAAPEAAAPAPVPKEAAAPAAVPLAGLAGLSGAGTGPEALAVGLAGRPAADRAAALHALSRGAGNAQVARLVRTSAANVLARQPAPAAAAAAPAAQPAADSWRHEEARSRAAALEKPIEQAKPKDRGLELYMELVPAVVRAVKGYSTADGKQVPIENAMLIIAQGSEEHAPYDPKTMNRPPVPAGYMLWGVTSDSEDPGATVRTTTDEEIGGVRASQSNRKFRAYGSMEEAATGYLRALEGTDPDAAKNPKYQKVLDVLTTPGATPEQFGKVLDEVHYATASDYGTKVAENARGDKSWASAKRLVKKFMPQIKAGQQDKIEALQSKQAGYADLLDWIDFKMDDLRQQAAALGPDSDQTAAIQQELQQLAADRATAQSIVSRLDGELAKEAQLLADLDEFGATLDPAAPGGAAGP